MENQALFCSKVKSKKLKCRLLQFLFGALKGNSKQMSGHKSLQRSYNKGLRVVLAGLVLKEVL